MNSERRTGRPAGDRPERRPARPERRPSRPERSVRPERADRPARPDRPPPRPGLQRRLDEPPTPTDVDLRDLDRRVRAELRGLPKELAEIVAAHLIAAGRLVDEDPAAAYAHAEAARRRAARLPIVREATAETAYAAGRYDVALAEYRALRRMTGNPDFLPVMADCERALGRTDAALKLVREGHGAELSVDQWAELRIVEAGIRDDVGQRPEALRVLGEAITQLGRRATSRRPEVRDGLIRLHYAYAERLLADGDAERARAAFATAADLDVEQTTDAHERVDALDGVEIVFDDAEEEDDPS